MLETKKANLTKKDISKKINLITGLPTFYIYNIVDDLINILKSQIKTNGINVKNFAAIKIIDKKERIGRNPKDNKEYKINAMKSIKIIFSKKINDQVKDL